MLLVRTILLLFRVSALIIYFNSPLWVIQNNLLKLKCLILPKREQHRKQFLRYIPGQQETVTSHLIDKNKWMRCRNKNCKSKTKFPKCSQCNIPMLHNDSVFLILVNNEFISTENGVKKVAPSPFQVVSENEYCWRLSPNDITTDNPTGHPRNLINSC
ncbi:hypothetical protein C0J52_24556 [Blattella germanica]|nr:hypothetical protein C0J52_24556 [Blattella germanica]